MRKSQMNYKLKYDKLIEYYRKNLSEGYVEKHHIIPKCVGGTDDVNNLILLPARAHFLAHYLLHKCYPDNRKLAHAFAMMGVCNEHQHRNSRLYEKSKLARSAALIGVPRPEWVKEKLRKPKSTTVNYKKPKTKEHAKNISKSLSGKRKSEQHIKRMVEGQRKFHERRTSEMEQRKQHYRKLFVTDGLNRKDFYLKYGLHPSTGKRYLCGL